MSKTINDLIAMSADAFTDPSNFLTDYDTNNQTYIAEQFYKGLNTGREATQITISIRNVWSARLPSGYMIYSYETIGWHAGTAALLQGFLASGVKIIVYRQLLNGTIEETVIQE